ncbi:MAG: DUF4446 family protein [Candidatus Levybacteria bacterium]|nr:DUF4446 family protein [Candidatus Levybacteria bacterium]
MQLSLELIFIFILLIWVAALSFFLWKTRSQYQLFVEGSDQKTLSGFLEGVVRSLSDTKKQLHENSVRLEKIETDEMFHIQKVGLLRFNPFRDTGGDQSFVLALTDANDSGIVVSALYSRSGTRWYAKKVIHGKGEEYELSAEEVKAIKLAKNNKKP